jgi:predicted dinucleotide-binding enzyme
MRIGIIGAGMIGSTLAKLWSEAGHEVRLASRHPEHLKDLVEHSGRWFQPARRWMRANSATWSW